MPKLDFESFNPDCFVSPDELNPWLEYIELTVSRDIHKEWFPDEIVNEQVVMDLYCYLLHKQCAMICRLSGNLTLAGNHEKMCDEMCASLPDYAKW